jgi:oxalyl-CoA decarboxylase
LKPGQVKPSASWLQALDEHKKRNADRMAARLTANPTPMDFHNALGAIHGVLADQPEIYIVNEGANTLDTGRNVLAMRAPRKRLDCGTWGVMGIGQGYAIAAAVVSGKPVVAIEGDSAFGFSGMEIETICRYNLPIVVVVFNNAGIYRGDDLNRVEGSDPSPTGLMRNARYDKLIEAFGGTGHHVENPQSLTRALRDALASRKPALINCVIDPNAGTESGHIQHLNPQSAVGPAR